MSVNYKYVSKITPGITSIKRCMNYTYSNYDFSGVGSNEVVKGKLF